MDNAKTQEFLPFIHCETRMPKIASIAIALASIFAAVPSVGAAPMSKCIVKGTVTYQQGPCTSDQVRRQPTIEELNAEEKKRRAATTAKASEKVAPAPASVASGFSCDGRQYCSQMKSCAEAKYFLSNCPTAKMDGDKNGIPCEKQWCNR
jgi:Excalibur calcium-binding domain